MSRERSLDEAWVVVEEALPEGWWLDRLQFEGRNVEFANGTRQRYDWWEAWAEGPKRTDAYGVGSTPVDALQDLARCLRERGG